MDLATREGILAFLELQKKAVIGLFDRVGEVRPHAIVFSDRDLDGKPVRDAHGTPVTEACFVFPDDFGDPLAKDLFTAGLERMLKDTNAFGVMMISEVWHAAPPPGAGRSALPRNFSDKPFAERREAIMVILEHVALEKPVMIYAEIERSNSGKGYTKPFADMNDGARHAIVAGRFGHLLRRAAS